jgi:L-asparaginase
MAENRKRIYIAYTGGTIGMRRSDRGWVPAPGFLAEQMAAMPELRVSGMPEYVIEEGSPLLDSSNMRPTNWVKIAEDLQRNYDAFDGFIVLHGTDTMAYTASALSFMLSGLTKPVLLTGSQVPLCEVRNDARDNLITSLLIAANHPVPEVCLYFNGLLLRGNRAKKVDSNSFEAFASPNFAPLGTVGVDIAIDWTRVLEPGVGAFGFRPVTSTHVAEIRLFPGISATVIRNFLRTPLQGVVLGTYGVGNAPDQDAEFLSALHEASERGVVIVSCSQCLRGTVDLKGYATGSALSRAGVISGHDMTSEATLTKLAFLLSHDLPVAETRRLMEQDLRGELTTPVHAPS